jgi:hypothetical protein
LNVLFRPTVLTVSRSGSIQVQAASAYMHVQHLRELCVFNPSRLERKRFRIRRRLVKALAPLDDPAIFALLDAYYHARWRADIAAARTTLAEEAAAAAAQPTAAGAPRDAGSDSDESAIVLTQGRTLAVKSARPMGVSSPLAPAHPVALRIVSPTAAARAGIPESAAAAAADGMRPVSALVLGQGKRTGTAAGSVAKKAKPQSLVLGSMSKLAVPASEPVTTASTPAAAVAAGAGAAPGSATKSSKTALPASPASASKPTKTPATPVLAGATKQVKSPATPTVSVKKSKPSASVSSPAKKTKIRPAALASLPPLPMFPLPVTPAAASQCVVIPDEDEPVVVVDEWGTDDEGAPVFKLVPPTPDQHPKKPAATVGQKRQR